MYTTKIVDSQVCLERLMDEKTGNSDQVIPFAFELTYEEFGKRYRFVKKEKKWVPRKRNLRDVVVRMYMGYPGTPKFYLRKLLRNRPVPEVTTTDADAYLLDVTDLMYNPVTNTVFKTYKEVCVEMGLVDSTTEFYDALSDAKDMGFGSWKLLGLFAQMIINTDVNNIKELWDGPTTDPEEWTETEKKYPVGYKRLMMQYPKNVKRRKDFKYDYDNLPNDELKNLCEQHTLRMLEKMLTRSGADYPEELPPLQEIDREQETQEWLQAFNYDSSIGEKIYDKNISTMNEGQMKVLNVVQDEIEKYVKDPRTYEGFVGMLDAPGGTGKTFLIETLAAFCALPQNNYLCLCSAFSGVAAQLLPNGVTIHRRFGVTVQIKMKTEVRWYLEWIQKILAISRNNPRRRNCYKKQN